MDTFSIVRAALAKSESDQQIGLVRDDIAEAARIVHAVQVVTDALTPPDGGRYIVGFANMATAATDLASRRIIVSSKPLKDPTLSLVEKAVVVATFTAHEIGHAEITKPKNEAVNAHIALKGKGYHSVANLADDIILEPWMIDRYPILTDAFEFTGMWVLRSTRGTEPKREQGGWKSPADRFNTILSATRFGDIPEIVWATKVAREERDWGRDWAARLIAADVRDVPAFLSLTDEMWERINGRPDIDPEWTEPEPPVITEPEGEPEPTDEGGEDEPEPGPEGPEGPEGGCKFPIPGKGEPTDEDGEPGEGEGEPGLVPADDLPDSFDGSEDDGEDEGEGTPEGPDEGGEKIGGGDESEGGEPDDEDEPDDPDTDADEATDRKGDGGGGSATQGAQEPVGDWDDEWDEEAVAETTHDQSESQGDDEATEAAVREYDNTERMAFGKHGTAAVRWE